MALSRELELLAEQLKSPDRMVRMRALVLLVNKGDTSIEPILQKLAAKDESTEIRYYAKKAIGMLAQKLAAAPPAPALEEPHYVRPESLSGPAPAVPAEPTVDDVRRFILLGDVRQKVLGLKMACDRQMRELSGDVGELLKNEQDPVALSAAAIAAGKLGGPAHSRKLVNLLEHSDHRVRANAIDALEATGDAAVFPYLIRCLRDEDNRCRANAARALRTYGPVNQKETLRLMLESDDVWMQDSAAYVLGFLTDPGAFSLFNIALRSPHRLVRDQVRTSLQRLKEKGVERAADLLTRLGGERQRRSEEELFERLSRATADVKLPLENAPATTADSTADRAAASLPETVAQEPARPSVSPLPPPDTVAPISPVTPEPAAAVPPDVSLPLDLAPAYQPSAPVEPGAEERLRHREAKASPFFRPAPRAQVRKKSAEEALAALSGVDKAEVSDLDFLVKEELRQDAVHERLARAGEETAVDRFEVSLTASQRAAQALQNLGNLAVPDAVGQMPADREEQRQTRARERLEEDLKGIAATRDRAEAMRDKADREDAVFARLRALGAGAD